MWLTLTLLGIIALLGLVLYTARTQRHTRVEFPNYAGLEDVYPTLTHLTGAACTGSNRVQVLQNGDGFYPALLEAFDQAEHHIHFETYAWWRGDICERVAECLAERARAGVQVRLLLDALGSFKAQRKLIDQMREAGCAVEKFHPFHWRTIGRINKRNHRKCAIIDAKVAFVMAHGVASEWEGDGDGPGRWRDTGVRIEGPVVKQVQGAFANDWMEETGLALAGQDFFPDHECDYGDVTRPVRCQLVASSPRGGVSNVSLLLKIMIGAADHEILIQNPYFCPDEQWLGMLSRAVENGVKVTVMVPGHHNDAKSIRWAGRHQYQRLLDAGVALYEYTRSMIHQKIMIIDGTWSHVGSTNFDERSFDINAELSLGIHDEAIAAELRDQFHIDLEHAERIEPERWRHRPIHHRLAEKLWFQVHEQL